jgi:hypothetical protein
MGDPFARSPVVAVAANAGNGTLRAMHNAEHNGLTFDRTPTVPPFRIDRERRDARVCQFDCK